jgi:hypothetical protein
LVWVLFREGVELFAGRADVDGVDAGGAVGEAAVCYAETDTWGLVGNWEMMIRWWYEPLLAPVIAMILPSSCTFLTGAVSELDAMLYVG